MIEYIVLDTETTGLDAAEHALVEIAAIRVRNGQAFEYFSTLISPGRHIPPEASAIHHITDAQVATAPAWSEVRDALLRFVGDLPIVAHNAEFDRSFLTELHDAPWICSCRIARHLWPAAPRHGNQGLRYWLGLSVDATLAHRAVDDARVTAAIFARELHDLRAAGIDMSSASLLEYCRRPIQLRTMPFGRHRGQSIEALPESYLAWSITNAVGDADLRHTLRSEHERRNVHAANVLTTQST